MGQYAHRDAQRRTLANEFRAIRPARKPLSRWENAYRCASLLVEPQITGVDGNTTR